RLRALGARSNVPGLASRVSPRRWFRSAPRRRATWERACVVESIEPGRERATRTRPARVFLLRSEGGAMRTLHGVAVLVVVAAALVAYAQEQIIYPAKGQSAQQQDKDKYECYGWAKGQTGFDPMALPVTSTPAPEAGGRSVAGGALGGAAGGAAVGAVGGLI